MRLLGAQSTRLEGAAGGNLRTEGAGALQGWPQPAMLCVEGRVRRQATRLGTFVHGLSLGLPGFRCALRDRAVG
jgi:hypothetical protein